MLEAIIHHCIREFATDNVQGTSLTRFYKIVEEGAARHTVANLAQEVDAAFVEHVWAHLRQDSSISIGVASLAPPPFEKKGKARGKRASTNVDQDEVDLSEDETTERAQRSITIYEVDTLRDFRDKSLSELKELHGDDLHIVLDEARARFLLTGTSDNSLLPSEERWACFLFLASRREQGSTVVEMSYVIANHRRKFPNTARAAIKQNIVWSQVRSLCESGLALKFDNKANQGSSSVVFKPYASQHRFYSEEVEGINISAAIPPSLPVDLLQDHEANDGPKLLQASSGVDVDVDVDGDGDGSDDEDAGHQLPVVQLGAYEEHLHQLDVLSVEEAIKLVFENRAALFARLLSVISNGKRNTAVRRELTGLAGIGAACSNHERAELAKRRIKSAVINLYDKGYIERQSGRFSSSASSKSSCRVVRLTAKGAEVLESLLSGSSATDDDVEEQMLDSGSIEHQLNSLNHTLVAEVGLSRQILEQVASAGVEGLTTKDMVDKSHACQTDRLGARRLLSELVDEMQYLAPSARSNDSSVAIPPAHCDGAVFVARESEGSAVQRRHFCVRAAVEKDLLPSDSLNGLRSRNAFVDLPVSELFYQNASERTEHELHQTMAIRPKKRGRPKGSKDSGKRVKRTSEMLEQDEQDDSSLKRKRGRPRLPRDEDGKIIRDAKPAPKKVKQEQAAKKAPPTKHARLTQPGNSENSDHEGIVEAALQFSVSAAQPPAAPPSGAQQMTKKRRSLPDEDNSHTLEYSRSSSTSQNLEHQASHPARAPTATPVGQSGPPAKRQRRDSLRAESASPSRSAGGRAQALDEVGSVTEEAMDDIETSRQSAAVDSSSLFSSKKSQPKPKPPAKSKPLTTNLTRNLRMKRILQAIESLGGACTELQLKRALEKLGKSEPLPTNSTQYWFDDQKVRASLLRELKEDGKLGRTTVIQTTPSETDEPARQAVLETLYLEDMDKAKLAAALAEMSVAKKIKSQKKAKSSKRKGPKGFAQLVPVGDADVAARVTGFVSVVVDRIKRSSKSQLLYGAVEEDMASITSIVERRRGLIPGESARLRHFHLEVMRMLQDDPDNEAVVSANDGVFDVSYFWSACPVSLYLQLVGLPIRRGMPAVHEYGHVPVDLVNDEVKTALQLTEGKQAIHSLCYKLARLKAITPTKITSNGTSFEDIPLLQCQGCVLWAFYQDQVPLRAISDLPDGVPSAASLPIQDMDDAVRYWDTLKQFVTAEADLHAARITSSEQALARQLRAEHSWKPSHNPHATQYVLLRRFAEDADATRQTIEDAATLELLSRVSFVARDELLAYLRRRLDMQVNHANVVASEETEQLTLTKKELRAEKRAQKEREAQWDSLVEEAFGAGVAEKDPTAKFGRLRLDFVKRRLEIDFESLRSHFMKPVIAWRQGHDFEALEKRKKADAAAQQAREAKDAKLLAKEAHAARPPKGSKPATRHRRPWLSADDALLMDAVVILRARQKAKKKERGGQSNVNPSRSIFLDRDDISTTMIRARIKELERPMGEDRFFQQLEAAWTELWQEFRGTDHLRDDDLQSFSISDDLLAEYISFLRQNIDKDDVFAQVARANKASPLPMNVSSLQQHWRWRDAVKNDSRFVDVDPRTFLITRPELRAALPPWESVAQSAAMMIASTSENVYTDAAGSEFAKNVGEDAISQATENLIASGALVSNVPGNRPAPGRTLRFSHNQRISTPFSKHFVQAVSQSLSHVVTQLKDRFPSTFDHEDGIVAILLAFLSERKLSIHIDHGHEVLIKLRDAQYLNIRKSLDDDHLEFPIDFSFRDRDVVDEKLACPPSLPDVPEPLACLQSLSDLGSENFAGRVGNSWKAAERAGRSKVTKTALSQLNRALDEAEERGIKEADLPNVFINVPEAVQENVLSIALQPCESIAPAFWGNHGYDGSRSLISSKYLSHWAVQTVPRGNSAAITIQPRTWLDLHGDAAAPIWLRGVELVNMWALSRPGISKTSLSMLFWPEYTPADTSELIEGACSMSVVSNAACGTKDKGLEIRKSGWFWASGEADGDTEVTEH